jgi:hypothetical protein
VVGLAVHAPTDVLAATTHDGQVQLWQLEKGERFGEFVAVPRSEVISTGN